MLGVTADTNIFVSGLVFPRGKPFQLLELAREGRIDLAVSEEILDELAGVLGNKFKWPPEDILEARQRIKGMARTVRPTVTLDVVKDDRDDNRIVECAVSAGSDYIVTGDKDLLRLGRHDRVRIVTVADFLDLLKAPAKGV